MVDHLRVVGCKTFCQVDKVHRDGKFSAKAWIGVLVGYSIDTPGYRVWDPATHKVWDVRALDFDELVRGGWWKQPAAVDKPAWGGDEPLHFDYVDDLPVDPLVEQPGAIVPVPLAANDDDGKDRKQSNLVEVQEVDYSMMSTRTTTTLQR